MFGASNGRVEIDIADGWPIYRQALEMIGHADWSRSLMLLAEAETTFRTADDHQGLWRALIGQSLLHWRDGAMALAIARAMAALRAAEAAADGFAFGCVAWQVANMMIGQGEYRKAADFLDQAQLALDAVGLAPLGGALAAAAQLCVEIGRWQQMRERGQIGQREAESAIVEIQHDLIGRLNQAAGSMRSVPVDITSVGGAEGRFLLPGPPAMLAMPDMIGPEGGLSGWLSRLWQRLIHGDDAPLAEPLTRLQAPTGPPIQPADVDSYAARAEESIVEVVAQAEPEIALVVDTSSEVVLQPRAAHDRVDAVHASGLAIYCFGNFRVYCNDVLIDRWDSARGRTIFKYLVARRATAVPKEVLADMFWPDSEPELARRSLHQAIYCLRQTFKRLLPDIQVIRFSNDRYQINLDMAIWVDSEAFSQAIEQARAHYAAGKVEQAMQAYAVAVDLYHAPFLAEDRYEEWTDEPRRANQAMYLEALHRLARHHVERGEHPAAILLCQRALVEESCDEESHQMLMACYMAQGLRHLAVRQFQICANALKTELGLTPSEELEAFYRRVVATG
jgi:DNA-binding SARP family transcriptional activator